MKNIKIHATQLFDGFQLCDSNKVLICDYQGVVIDVVSRELAGEDVQELEGLVMPGMINAHCHLELSHLKGVIPKHTGLPQFLTQVMENRAQVPLEKINEAMEDALREMEAAGIVAVGDISNTSLSIALKQTSSLHWVNFIECMGVAASKAEIRLEAAREVQKSFVAAGLEATLVPHAPYSVSPKLFRLIKEQNQPGPKTIHNQECAAENSLFESGNGAFISFFEHFGMDYSALPATGKSSLRSYFADYADSYPNLLVHNTQTSPEDIAFANRSNTYWCFCPLANLYIENTLPNIPSFLDHAQQLVLGTDSLASNDRLSIWDEIQTLQSQYNLSLESLLPWCTSNAARALGIEKQYGSFHKGAKPGVIHIFADQINRLA